VDHKYPVTGAIYTLLEMTELSLPDEPFLRFRHQGEIAVIQEGGTISTEELLAIPEIANSKWRYQYTTHEYIPLFMYAGESDILELVTVEDNLHNDHGDDPFWAYFKADPRPQQ
jgi:hypothetical protein